MRVLGYNETVAALEFPPLVEALRQAFRKTDFETPSADLHSLAVPDEPTGSLIVLPAWLPGKNFGVRLTTEFPRQRRAQQAGARAAATSSATARPARSSRSSTGRR